jgi:phospho-N-acetylmuramoyl-pentapeptide-transferase
VIWGIWAIASFSGYYWGIKWSQKKAWHQPIYADSPESHQHKKGTPTMGGVVMAMSFLAGVGVLNQWSSPVVWVVAAALGFGCIGAIDDAISIVRGSNRGLLARQKFALQWVLSLALMMIYSYWVTPLHWAMVLFYAFVMTGASNATNLTDGLDGLLSTTMLVSLAGLLWVQMTQPEWFNLTRLMMACIAIFLIFNWHPARVFMGDSGSLMLGAFLAASVIAMGHWPILIGLGAVYVIETLSVMVQVAVYKCTQRRVFLMTPLHHHFELLGCTDTGVVALFAVIQGIFVVIQLL